MCLKLASPILGKDVVKKFESVKNHYLIVVLMRNQDG